MGQTPERLSDVRFGSRYGRETTWEGLLQRGTLYPLFTVVEPKPPRTVVDDGTSGPGVRDGPERMIPIRL